MCLTECRASSELPAEIPATGNLLTDLERELSPYIEAARTLEGSQLDFAPEPLRAGPPWDYEAIAHEACSLARTVVDLGTGGGEVFSRILSGTSCDAIATEWWYRNAPIAARRLAGRPGAVRTSSLSLPFASGAFDLVLSRHEEIRPSEVDRTLAPGGIFLTQQMVPDLWHELRAVFPDMARYPDHQVEYRRNFEHAGLVVGQFSARVADHPDVVAVNGHTAGAGGEPLERVGHEDVQHLGRTDAIEDGDAGCVLPALEDRFGQRLTCRYGEP